jgi:hypothetical protein
MRHHDETCENHPIFRGAKKALITKVKQSTLATKERLTQKAKELTLCAIMVSTTLCQNEKNMTNLTVRNLGLQREEVRQ